MIDPTSPRIEKKTQSEASIFGDREGTTPITNIATRLFAFFAFCFAYYLPVLLDTSTLSGILSEPRVLGLLYGLLQTKIAQLEILRNALGHLLLLAATYWLLLQVAEGLAKKFRIHRLVMRAAILFLGWIFLLSLNGLLFPRSNYSFAFLLLVRPELCYIIGAFLFVSYVALVAKSPGHRKKATWAFTLVLSLLAITVMPAFSTVSTSGRNVIVVGIDSLSNPAFTRLELSLPNISHLVNAGARYERAYTPLGRTFPAWVSILSGEEPAKHGAIFNLRNMEHVEKKNLISTELRSRGYRTVYAIDERRFNNIDKSFGFDDVIGPDAGALDFIVQRLNDTPLTNLLLQTTLGRIFLPYSYINTASVPNYDAEGFVDSVLGSIKGAKQLFLAVHFESAHFPFETRHARQRFQTPNDVWNKHAEALTVVDAQVGELMSGLRKQGYLDNALVIVLSDHGEGLGEVEARLNIGGISTEIRGYGHGMSVLSDHQNHIVLAVAEFRNGVQTNSGSASDKYVSLLDIRSLIERFVATGSTAIESSSKCLMVETDIRLTSIADYHSLNETAAATSSADFYEIDSQGRLRLREDRLPELINAKDIGVRCEDHLTWWDYGHHKYFAVELDRDGKPIRELLPSPDEIRSIESYRRQLLTSVAEH